jgi:predicted nucleotidyltransferase
MTVIERIIPSRIRLLILRLFLLEKNRKAGIREVAKITGAHPSQAKLELENLQKAGILKSEKIGNSLIYSLDEGCDAVSPLIQILSKTTGFEELIRKAISSVTGINAAFIFGSFASGDLQEKSDIDLFIIGTPDISLLNSEIRKTEKVINREIQYVVMPDKEFKKKRSYGFVRNVINSKKIFLIGDEHGLG